MHNESTNLLPPERQSAITRNYVIRVGVVIVVLATALVVSAAVLLIPTFVLLTGSAQAKRDHLASLESKLSSAEEATLLTRLAALSSNAEVLAALADAPSVSATIRSFLTVGRPGITLSGFSFTPPTNKSLGTLAVSGTSVTRDALRKYQLALQEAPFIRSAVLPVSAYAKDSDIDFTITITLVP